VDYDPAKHHIGIAAEGETAQGYMLESPYRRDFQKESIPSEFGGTEDRISGVPSFSRWTQDDFLGGQYGYIWGEDNRQFARCKSLLPTQYGTSLRTIPPMWHWEAEADPGFSDKTLHNGTATDHKAVAVTYGDYLWRISRDKLETWRISTGDYIHYSLSVDGPFADTFWQAAALDAGRGLIWLVRRASAGGKAVYTVPAAHPDMAVKQVPTLVEALSGSSSPTTPDALGCFGWIFDGGLLYGAWGPRELWVTTINDNLVDLTWSEAGSLDGQWQAGVAYNSLIYILLADENSRAKLVVYDGTEVLPLVDFPFNFTGRCMTVYGGRLYVGGTGKDIAGSDAYAELYEVTGSTLRLVRTFAPESRVQLSGEEPPTAIGTMHVHEGLLFIGTDQDHLLVYDITNDSLFGGPVVDDDGIGVAEVRHILSSRESLTALVNLDDASSRLVRLGQAGPMPGTYDCTFETSDFQPQPSTDKRWSLVHVHTRYLPIDAIDYSQDGGASWTALTLMSMQEGEFWHNEADLTGADISTRIRFRFTWSPDNETTQAGELVAFTVQFLFLDSTKRSWAMTVVGSDRAEAEDGTTLVQDPGTDLAQLEAYAVSREKLTFTDLDGSTYNVIVRDCSVHMPEIGPALAGGAREAFANLTLTEA